MASFGRPGEQVDLLDLGFDSVDVSALNEPLDLGFDSVCDVSAV